MSTDQNRKIGIVSGDIFKKHSAEGQHPECPERLDAVESALRRSIAVEQLRPVPLREATREELQRIHTKRFLDAVMVEISNGSGYLDADTFYSPGSKHAALCAAGGGIDLVKLVHSRAIETGFAAVRPPGHHATPGRPMGFCIFNNIALAAEALLHETDATRVAIFDWDVHHGNGTQDAFYDRGDVLFCSTHQWPHYPGSGLAEEIGSGTGLGRTLNFPFAAGTGEADYLCAIDHIFEPICREFKPDHILVSAGFDAHCNDPLSNMNLTSESFGVIASRLRKIAETLCGGRMTLFLEGGYNLNALKESVSATSDALLQPDCAISLTSPSPSPAAKRLFTRIIAAMKPYWPGVFQDN